MSELGAIAKGAIGALEKAKAFDARTKKLREQARDFFVLSDKQARQFDMPYYDTPVYFKHVDTLNKLDEHLAKKLPIEDLSIRLGDWHNESGIIHHLEKFETLAQKTVHHTPEQKKIFNELLPQHDYDPDVALQHTEALSRLNPQQQEIYKSLLPEWHADSGSLEETARNL